MGQGYLWQFTDCLKIDNHFFDANILYDLRKDTFLHGGDFFVCALPAKLSIFAKIQLGTKSALFRVTLLIVDIG